MQKQGGKSEKETQNERIYTKTRPNFVLQYIERANWP